MLWKFHLFRKDAYLFTKFINYNSSVAQSYVAQGSDTTMILWKTTVRNQKKYKATISMKTALAFKFTLTANAVQLFSFRNLIFPLG